MKKSLLTLVFVAITALSVSAQYRCGTDVMNNRYRSRNPFFGTITGQLQSIDAGRND